MMYQGAALFALFRVLLPIGALAAADPPAAVPPKEEPPKEERAGLIKRSLHRVFRDDDKPGAGRGVRFGPIAPRVGILSSGARPGPIVHFWAPDLGNSSLDLHASAAVSILKYQYYDLQLGLLSHDGERLPRIETSTTRAGILRTSILPGRDSAAPNVEDAHTDTAAPGLIRAPDFNVLAFGAWLELRDEPGNPHRGASFAATYAHYDDRTGDAFKFSRLSLDAREYIRSTSPPLPHSTPARSRGASPSG